MPSAGKEAVGGRQACDKPSGGVCERGGPLGCGGDPIHAPLKADGHSALGQPDQMPADDDSPIGWLHFVGTGPSCLLECT